MRVSHFRFWWVVSVLLFFSAVLLPAGALRSQELDFSYSSPRRYIIRDVTVSGIQFLEPPVLVSLSGLRVGDTIELPGTALTDAVKKLLEQNLFSDVKIGATHLEGDQITLEIRLAEQPRISSIEYEGIKSSAREDLEEKLSLRVGHQATPSTLDAAKRMIRKYFLDKGYLNVTVDSRQVVDTTMLNTVRVTFVVNRGKKVKVREIDFTGNNSLTDKKLRRKGFKDTKQLDWNIFQSTKFIESKYRADLKNLITYYNEHGFRDARVVRDTVYRLKKPNRLGIHVEVDEGPRYHVREIRWVGNTVYPSLILTDMLGLETGDVYDQTLIEKRLFTDENSISTAYMDNGYLFFQVNPTEVDVSNDSVTLEMRVFEGPQATISDVQIFGNTRTNEHVIRRELRTLPGDLFSKSNIIRSLRELANLNYFNPETLDIKPIPNPADGTVSLRYTVEEKSSDQFELSGGFGGGMFVGSLGVRFSNFSIGRLFDGKAWRPIPSGDGQSLSIRATTNGSQYRAISLSFTEPWLGGKKPNNFSVSFYHSVYDYSKFLFRPSDDYFKITGASVGLGTRLSWPDDFFTFYSEASYQNYNLRNWRQDFLFTDGQANNLSFRFVWGRNSVDQLIYPRSGSNFSLSVQATPPYSLFNGKDYTSPQMTQQERYRWIEYHKWTARAQWYSALIGDLVLYLNAQFGYLGYYNRALGYSPFEGFDLGGDGLSNQSFIYGRENIGLRGYSNGSLTPIVGQGVRIANVYDKFTLELRYPVVLKPMSSVYLLLFAEAGNAWYELNEFNPFELHRSVGAGVRVFLPMIGMLGFDIGYGFDAVRHDPKAHRWQPHFIIGMPF